MKSFYLIVRRLLLTWEPFDPDACGLVTRWASVFCVAAVTAAMAILLIARDGTPSCPGWQPAQGRADLWPVILIIFAPAAAWIGYMAIFWKQFFRDIDHGEQARFDAMAPTNSVYVMVVIGWCAFCSIPLVMLFVSCTGWFGSRAWGWVPFL